MYMFSSILSHFIQPLSLLEAKINRTQLATQIITPQLTLGLMSYLASFPSYGYWAALRVYIFCLCFAGGISSPVRSSVASMKQKTGKSPILINTREQVNQYYHLPSMLSTKKESTIWINHSWGKWSWINRSWDRWSWTNCSWGSCYTHNAIRDPIRDGVLNILAVQLRLCRGYVNGHGISLH